MPFQFRGLDWREDPTSGPDENFSLESGQVTMAMYWDYATRKDYVEQFLGYTTIELDGTWKYLNRVTPFYHPKYTGDSALWAQSVQLVGDGAPKIYDANNLASFKDARVKLAMADRPYRILTNTEMTSQQLASGHPIIASPDETTLWRYVSVEKTPRSKFQTLPSMAAFMINATGTPVANTHAILLPESNISITWHQIPRRAIPFTAIDACQGQSNRFDLGLAAGSLTVLGGIMKAGTLVFNTYSLRKEYRMVNGEFATDITYNFVYYPRGANNFYVIPPLPNNPGFYAVSRDGASSINIATGAVVGSVDALPFPLSLDYLGLFRPEP